MGFCAIVKDELIYSFTINDQSWQHLKENYKELGMSMPCCKTAAIPKKNKLGTQYFAHHPSSSCGFSSGESREHQLCKYLILKYLHDHGWTVLPEHRGQTPDGEVWIADIYAEKNNAKLVVEIQWSPQTIEETQRRQEKYIKSGIRAVWFMRTTYKNQSDVLDYQSYEQPVFSITLNRETRQILTSGAFHDYDAHRLAEVEFIKFFDALMTGAIQYSHKPNAYRLIQLAMNTIQCWKCHRPTNAIMYVNYYMTHGDIIKKIGRVDKKRIPLTHLAIINQVQYMQQYQYGALKERWSKTVGEHYLSNGCYHCDALMGDHFLSREYDPSLIIQSEYLPVQVDPESVTNGDWYYLKN